MSDVSAVSKRSNKQPLAIVALVSFVLFVASLIVCGLYNSSEAKNYEEAVAMNSHCRSLHAEKPNTGLSSIQEGVQEGIDQARKMQQSPPLFIFVPGTGGETMHQMSTCSLPEIKPWFENIPKGLAQGTMGVSLTVFLMEMLWRNRDRAKIRK